MVVKSRWRWELNPFVLGVDNDDIGRRPPPPPLKLPGRFGREALLRPFSTSCPTCRRRPSHRRKLRRRDDDVPPSWCVLCSSIRSMAKFIPRADFWSFTCNRRECDENDGRGRGGIRLAISGGDAYRLVRIHRLAEEEEGGGGCATASADENSDERDDPRLLELYEGDVLSLLWHGGQHDGGDGAIDYTSLAPLVQFRLTRINPEDTEVDPGLPTLVSTLIGSGNAVEGDVATFIRGDLHEAKNEQGDGSSRREDDAENYIACDSNDRYSPSSSSGGGHTFNIHGLVRTVTKDDSIARGNCFRDARDIYRNIENRQNLGNGGKGLLTANDDMDDGACPESIKGSSCDEEEAESAPLTLPSRFLASYSNSYSFESAENSPSIAHASLGVDIVECVGPTTPQKINLTGKRPQYYGMDSTEVAENTPKKSNITIEDKKYDSVSMSSLSFDQLNRLNKEATSLNIANETSPSLRRTVLSLTLALTSNVSLYDSNFMNDCKAEADEIMPEIGLQWMPRLLRGTQIKILQER